MTPRLGKVVLGLSAAGFPLTQLAIRQLGRRGTIVTESACVVLAVDVMRVDLDAAGAECADGADGRGGMAPPPVTCANSHPY